MWRHAPYLAKEAGYRLAAWSVRGLSLTVVEMILSFCGIWCLLTPLLLWVAWTPAIFFFLLGSAATACIVFCFVAIGVEDQEEADQGETDSLSKQPSPPTAEAPARRGSLPTWRDHA